MADETRVLTSAQRRFLETTFPADGCELGSAALAALGTDASRREAGAALAIVRPETPDQACELLRWAQAESMPVFPRARGTNMVGACVPTRPGVVVSTLRMNRIFAIDEDDFVAECGPGVVTAELQAECARKRLLYPPDPASLKISTIGGNISTCAGGMRAVKYGVTRDYVLGLDAVLPGGELIRLGGRNHKDVVGLDLTRLFVGSAGKLGLVTRCLLKLIPLPEAEASVLAGFAGLAEAIEGARRVFRAGVLPTACELMDDKSLEAVAAHADVPLPAGSRAALLLKIDGSKEGLGVELDRLRRALEAAGPVGLVTGRGADEEALWEVRRMIAPASHHFGSSKLAEDVAVPRGAVVRAVQGYVAAAERHGVVAINFGHLGDGNIHVNLMYDGESADATSRAHAALAEIFDLTLELGGTISGEHGTGLTKRDYVPRQLGSRELALMAAIKKQFDPSGIMNPGKGW